MVEPSTNSCVPPSSCVDGRVAYPEEDVLPLGFDGATD
jgi:hypothetical protein